MNRTDILDRTALHYAVRYNAADVTPLLIAYGAEIEAKDWKGRVPLDLVDEQDGRTVANALREEVSLRHARRAKALKVVNRHSNQPR